MAVVLDYYSYEADGVAGATSEPPRSGLCSVHLKRH